MAKMYPRSEALRSAQLDSETAYVSWDGKNAEKAFAEFTKSVSEYRGIKRAVGTWNQDLSDLAPNVSGRPGLSKDDYYRFRPGEKPPTDIKDIITVSDSIYHHVGLIRNIIDLMGDFACQGIRIVHPNKKIEKFYRAWWKKVEGKDRSERFTNTLFRLGTVVMRSHTARVSAKNEKTFYKTQGGEARGEVDFELENIKVTKREIPLRYSFINPTVVEVVGGALAAFVGDTQYAIKLPQNLRRAIQRASRGPEKSLLSKLPKEIIQAAKKNQAILLNPEKTSVFSYKKDDWQSFATPMIYAIMDDIAVLEKLKLADMAALDGAISNIRIFKLGSLEHKIMPTKTAASKLAEILESNVGGGTMDLVWGPDIELVESKTSVHEFLGEEKYKPHLNAIYAGLGIPPTLTGTLGAAGTTNNFISLKTLTQRLEYGRDILQEFWDQEFKKVQEAMGFRFPAKIEFSFTNLGDENAEKALWIQLADRNLMSDELIQAMFGNDPIMEKLRINREGRERNTGKMTPKAGPYHDPQFGVALKKLALQTGVSTPGQVGLRKDAQTRDLRMFEQEDGEKPGLEMRQPKPQETKKSGGPGGRPKNAKDTKKRKTKEFKPKIKAIMEIWAMSAQAAIAEVLNPMILTQYKKKNMRSLSKNQHIEAEKTKFGILSNLEPLGEVSHETIHTALCLGGVPSTMYHTYCQWVQEMSVDLDRTLTIDELKRVQACLYVSYIGDKDDG